MKRALWVFLAAMALAPAARAQSPVGIGVVTPSVSPGVDAIHAGDYRQAVRLLRPLAERGDANAQLWLSQLYTNGQGVKRDRSRGEIWCLIGLSAIAQSQPPSPQYQQTQGACALAKIGLTPKQIARVGRIAGAWRRADADGARTVQPYFDFQVPNLTREAEEVVEVAVLNAINADATEVDLVGRADTAEADPVALSHARAEAVRASMIRQGLSRKVRFKIEDKGAAEPFLDTGPGVREPLNRFVSITVR